MPRTNRRFLPIQFWQITHRCHKEKFLLKFARAALSNTITTSIWLTEPGQAHPLITACVKI
jgi:hypothetical protein